MLLLCLRLRKLLTIQLSSTHPFYPKKVNSRQRTCSCTVFTPIKLPSIRIQPSLRTFGTVIFFWNLPDHPSGISIFYCPETKSSNSSELERERNLALADKVNASDIEKLAKQKMSLPTSLMDLVWQTQNLLAVVS
jgi:hypothetical protein